MRTGPVAVDLVVQAMSRTASTTWASVTVRAATTRPARFQAAVGPRGDLAALLAQDPTDRLDRVALGSHGVDEPHDQRLRGSSSPTKKIVAALQDLDVLSQPAVLGLQRLDLGQLLAGRALALAAVDLGLDHPAAHRLLADTELLGHDRRAAVSEEYSPWWSSTSRTALAFSSSSIFFGMVLILLDSNRSGIKPGALQAPTTRPRRGPHPRAEGHRPAQPAFPRLRPEPDLARNRRPGRRPARLDPDARLRPAQPARRWEPKRLRLRLLAVAGRIIRSGRRRRLRLPRGWPWNHLIDTGWAALHNPLTQPPRPRDQDLGEPANTAPATTHALPPGPHLNDVLNDSRRSQVKDRGEWPRCGATGPELTAPLPAAAEFSKRQPGDISLDKSEASRRLREPMAFVPEHGRIV